MKGYRWALLAAALVAALSWFAVEMLVWLVTRD